MTPWFQPKPKETGDHIVAMMSYCWSMCNWITSVVWGGISLCLQDSDLKQNMQQNIKNTQNKPNGAGF